METYNKNLVKNGYNKEQIEFIVSPVESSKLIGIPGGGKSTCISEYVIHKKTMKILYDREILCVVFNKKAQLSLFEKLKDYNMNNFVKTFDSVSESFKKENNINISTPKDFEILSDDEKNNYHNGVKKKCELLLDNSDTTINFCKYIKVIIVDEAQDMNKTEFSIISKISKKLNDIPIILVGDSNNVFIIH